MVQVLGSPVYIYRVSTDWSDDITNIFFFCISAFWIRLKKKNSVSQSCRPHLFFCAHLILQNSDFHFFFLKYFLFSFHYEKRRKFAVLEECKHVGAQKTCKILFDFWKYGSWNFSVIFGFGCAWRQRPIEVKNNKIKNKKPHAASVWKILASFETKYFFFSLTCVGEAWWKTSTAQIWWFGGNRFMVTRDMAAWIPN